MSWNLWVHLLIYWPVLPNIANKCLLSLTFKARWAVTLRSQMRWLTSKCKNWNAHQLHKAYCAWMFQCMSLCGNHTTFYKLDKKLNKHNLQFMFVTQLCSWNMARSSNLVWICKPQGRLYVCDVWNPLLS